MDLPRVNSRTPLSNFGVSDPKPEHPMPLVVNPTFASFLCALHPRKPRQKLSLAAFLVLLSVITYISISNGTLLSSSALRHPEPQLPDPLTAALETIKQSQLLEITHKKSHRKGHLRLDPQQELAAVSSFLASLPANVIPHFVDPKHPIDPQLVLDFDTTSLRALEEVKVMIEDVWSRNPVFLYAKHFSSASREVKAILADFNLNPEPTIIEVDTREDAKILAPMLARLTSFPELPILLIGGNVVGSTEQIKALATNGELQKMITTAGGRIDGQRKKKSKK